MFTYAVKTERNNKHFTVLARGTKSDMLKYAEVFDAHPDTVESRIKREKDGAIVHSYARQ